jgi:hypothetical protein
MAGVWLPIRRGDCAANTAGVAEGDHAIGDIVIDETARADDDITADRNPGKDDAVSAKPYVASDTDRKRDLEILIPKPRVQWVQRSIKRAVRADEDVISEYDPARIDQNAVVVQKEVFTDFDIEPESAEQVRFDIKLFTRFTE